MPQPDQWFYISENQTRGPLSAQELAYLAGSGAIDARTQIARAGWTDWRPLGEVPEIPVQIVAAPDTMSSVIEVRSPVNHVPASAGAGRRMRRSAVTFVLLTLALVAGFEQKWQARKNALEARQTARAERIVERSDSYSKQGLALPRDLKGLTVQDWARLEPDDLDRKEKQLDSSWQQFQSGKQLVAQLGGVFEKRPGATGQTVAHVGYGLRAAGAEFERRKNEIDTLWRQFQKSRQS